MVLEYVHMLSSACVTLRASSALATSVMQAGRPQNTSGPGFPAHRGSDPLTLATHRQQIVKMHLTARHTGHTENEQQPIWSRT